jgi:hypothetical protein
VLVEVAEVRLLLLLLLVVLVVVVVLVALVVLVVVLLVLVVMVVMVAEVVKARVAVAVAVGGMECEARHASCQPSCCSCCPPAFRRVRGGCVGRAGDGRVRIAEIMALLLLLLAMAPLLMLLPLALLLVGLGRRQGASALAVPPLPLGPAPPALPLSALPPCLALPIRHRAMLPKSLPRPFARVRESARVLVVATALARLPALLAHRLALPAQGRRVRAEGPVVLGAFALLGGSSEGEQLPRGEEAVV